MALTDPQARLLAQEYRSGIVALEAARVTMQTAERALAQGIGAGNTLTVRGWRLYTPDGERIVATNERVVT